MRYTIAMDGAIVTNRIHKGTFPVNEFPANPCVGKSGTWRTVLVVQRQSEGIVSDQISDIVHMSVLVGNFKCDLTADRAKHCAWHGERWRSDDLITGTTFYGTRVFDGIAHAYATTMATAIQLKNLLRPPNQSVSVTRATELLDSNFISFDRLLQPGGGDALNVLLQETRTSLEQLNTRVSL